MPEILLHRGDIVLVPFPFTNLSTQKVRPAIVISPDPQSTDILIAFISSVLPAGELTKSDYLLKKSHPDFAKTGLKKESVFKMNKLLTIERTKILRRLGRVSSEIQKELDLCLQYATGLSHP